MVRPLRCDLADTARAFVSAFPGDTLYAVKCNPDPAVLRALWDGGLRHFDCASTAEVRLVRSMFPAASIHFMHPIKARGAIRDDMYGVMRGLTRTVASYTTSGSMSADRVKDWMAENRAALARANQVLGSVNDLPSPGLAPLSVALRTLRALVRQGAVGE